MTKICFDPIASVVSDYHNPQDLIFACEKGLRTMARSKIVVKKKYAEGILGIECFSHVFVLYHLDKVKRIELTTHPGPPAIESLPQVGIFASRSQYRPNPIALRLVSLLKVKGNILYVEGLDAINNTPVLDIKPYVKGFDRPADYRTASWYSWLES